MKNACKEEIIISQSMLSQLIQMIKNKIKIKKEGD